jgi:hypothetical protein
LLPPSEMQDGWAMYYRHMNKMQQLEKAFIKDFGM